MRDLQATLRQRDPDAYRAFVSRWEHLHQRGAAQRLLAMDDAALSERIARMILDQPALADLHPEARRSLGQQADTGAAPSRTVRLRRRPYRAGRPPES